MRKSVKRRVLVINDDRRMARSLLGLLAEVGYEAALAFDGREGLRVLAQWPADLVLLDLIMPRLDGWGFLRELAAHPPHPWPTVVVWSVASPEELDRARGLGAAECLSRPSTGPDQLLAAIDRLMNAS